MKGAFSAALRRETSMDPVSGWWTAGVERVRQAAQRLFRSEFKQPVSKAAAVEAEAPDCEMFSRFIRAVCAERETSVWWLVVSEDSANVYPMRSDPRLSAPEEQAVARHGIFADSRSHGAVASCGVAASTCNCE